MKPALAGVKWKEYVVAYEVLNIKHKKEVIFIDGSAYAVREYITTMLTMHLYCAFEIEITKMSSSA